MAFKAITTPLTHVKHDDSDDEMPGLDSACPNGAWSAPPSLTGGGGLSHAYFLPPASG